MRTLEPEQLAGVLAAAESTRDRALVALALDSGLRASEFGRLRPVDIATNAVRVFGKGSREAWVPITPETHHLLMVLLASRNGAGAMSPLFAHDDGRPMTRFTAYRTVRQCMDRANIPGPKRGPHCLRHSLGRHFIASGGDAFTLKQILRHRNIQTTQKYVHLAMRDVLSQHMKHSPLRAALRGSQGVLLDREVEEILHGASDTVPTPS